MQKSEFQKRDHPPTVVRNQYFNWLLDRLDLNEAQELARALHKTEFYWSIRNDENRASDGIALREEFTRQTGMDGQGALDGPCTVLEMLGALAERLEFQTGDARDESQFARWFWELLKNLDLHKMKDANFSDRCRRQIQKVLYQLMERKYDADGSGGLFPLRNPAKDQRQVEIWYQMFAWLKENYPVT